MHHFQNKRSIYEKVTERCKIFLTSCSLSLVQRHVNNYVYVCLVNKLIKRSIFEVFTKHSSVYLIRVTNDIHGSHRGINWKWLVTHVHGFDKWNVEKQRRDCLLRHEKCPRAFRIFDGKTGGFVLLKIRRGTTFSIHFPYLPKENQDLWFCIGWLGRCEPLASRSRYFLLKSARGGAANSPVEMKMNRCIFTIFHAVRLRRKFLAENVKTAKS